LNVLVPSPKQLEAIEAPTGPVLVVAGPGAGKTFCLIGRISHLINRLGIDPSRICAVTFTNKAADEIAQRLGRDIGAPAEDIARGTLHGLCFALLREHVSLVGLRRGFGMADEEYQRRVLRRLRVRKERHTQLLNLFGRHQLQNYPLTPGDLELFQEYQALLRSRNLVDYDDLIALAGSLLRCHPGIAEQIRARWDCILTDEFQDLSLAQYDVIRYLASEHRNCFAVGDDEQSIYSWAGADARILERFQQDFEIDQPIVLERNRRCSRQIFDVARHLISRNPALFTKDIEADRESPYCVAAYLFEDEGVESSWLLADLIRDQAASELAWGHYAMLYRTHRIGQQLETQLIQAGVPCRVARGQALCDDELIGFVISSLRVVRDPRDPVALDGFAETVLPCTLLQQVKVRHSDLELLPAFRAFARETRGDPDSRMAWRFVFHVENLAGLGRAHERLDSLVQELLSQRVGRYRNPMEERADELTDPLEFAGARMLARRLGQAAASGGRVWVEPDAGLEIPLQQMIRAGFDGEVLPLEITRNPAPNDVVIPARAVRPLLIFKALQLFRCDTLVDPLQDYVAFDLETTDVDPAQCEIVELAAVRVRNRVIVAQFQQLIRTNRPISPKASAVHGYEDADVCEQPTFAEVWPAFRGFVGSDVLVAHNGQTFDVPVLRRLAAGLPGVEELVFFDTLPLARSLIHESAKLTDLAHRFGVDAGRSHHALDDASALVGVLRSLGELKLARSRKLALPNLLGWLGLAFALHRPHDETPEERVLRDIALPATLGRYGNCLEVYAAECEAAGAPPLEELIERLGGARLMERIRTARSVAERYPSSVERLDALLKTSVAPTLRESIDLLLSRAALSKSDGCSVDDQRVNLLTLHSTKGLEFSRVYIVGAEDGQIPGLQALDDNIEHEIQEGRRLLYVGMTRAKDRLVLTRAERRDGHHTGGDLFLQEAGLQVIAAPPTADLLD
jgi:superfamily I DNA/RNA helicase/DNA polymerase III epsilon subunit-like protein